MTRTALDTRSTILRAAALTAAAGLAGCGYVDSYEEAVHDLEPRYCYQTLAKVECYAEPYPRYADHLVNYQGPHPSRYPVPEKPASPELKPPAPVDYWVKDPEPVPRPSPQGYREGSPPWSGQPSEPGTTPGEEQVSDAGPAAVGTVPLAAPAPSAAARPTLRAPARRSPVPLADPNQGYYLNGGPGSDRGSAGLGGGYAPAS